MNVTAGMLTLQGTNPWAPWGHMGWAGSWFMWIFWLAVLVLVLAAIHRLSTDSRDGRGPSEDPESVLKRRYAAGEIDEQTFQRMRDELRR